MKSVPRPSTAGRQRPSSASQNIPGQTTPRGTSSSITPLAPTLGGGRGDSSGVRISDDVLQFSGAAPPYSPTTRCLVSTATQTDGNEALEQQNAEDERRAARLRTEASLQSIAGLTKALNRQYERSAAVEEMSASRDKLLERVAELEAELLVFRKQRFENCTKPAGGTLATGKPKLGGLVGKKITIIDVTGTLSSLRSPTAAVRTGSNTSKAAIIDHQHHLHASHLDSEGASAATERHVGSHNETNLERLRREWRTQQQQHQQHNTLSETIISPKFVLPHGEVQQLLSVTMNTNGMSLPGAVESLRTFDNLAAHGTLSAQLQQQNTNHNEGVPSSGDGQMINSSASLREAMDAQQEIIQCLEKENTILRRQRDDQVTSNAKEHQRLMQELEDTQQTLDEKGADWHEKQKELNRLRTLMRFSQLKRDSDKLQETFVRIDELENRLRQVHAQHQRDALDREDLRRLRIVELQVKKVLCGELAFSSFPRELVHLPQQLQQHHTTTTTAADSGARGYAPLLLGGNESGGGGAPKTTFPVRPSTAKVTRNPMPTTNYNNIAHTNHGVTSTHSRTTPPLPPPPPLPYSRGDVVVDDFEITEDTAPTTCESTPVKGPPSEVSHSQDLYQPPVLSLQTQLQQPTVVVRDEDVSFSTITERMQAYLLRRTKQQEDEREQQRLLSHKQQRSVPQPIKPSSGKQYPAADSAVACGGSLSLFARRLEQLRNDHPSGGSIGALAAGARPQSASRSASSGQLGRGARPSSAVYSRRVL